MKYLLFTDKVEKMIEDAQGVKREQFNRLIEQCNSYFGTKLEEKHPPTSITYMGMAAANLSFAYLLTKQKQYLDEAKRFIFTACGYDCWGYGFLVDVDLSASWLLYGFGLSYNWISEYLSKEEKEIFLNKLILQGNKIFDYGQENKGNCWSTDFWQNHNWINYTGLLTTAYAISAEYDHAQVWLDEIHDNFDKVYKFMPKDGSNYEGTGYWKYAMNFLLSAADMIRQNTGVDYFKTGFLTNTFYYRLYQCAPNYEENVNFSDVHDRRSSHSISAYYKFANEYNNQYAQWLGKLVFDKFLFREAYQSKIFPGILPEAFLEYIWYNPNIKTKEPNDLPLTRYFPDLGLAVIRSSWEKDAIHFSIKSSAPGGNIQWEKSWELDIANGWRTRSLTHYHVDFNSFILMSNNAPLVIDEGFHRTSRAKLHNMLTVDNTGCIGEKIWENSSLADPVLFDLNCKGIYNVWTQVPRESVAYVVDFVSQDNHTYYCAESAKMYYKEMELESNRRHVVYSSLGYFIMIDVLKSNLEHTYTSRFHAEQFAEKVEDKEIYRIENGTGALNVYPLMSNDIEVSIEETLISEIMTPQRPLDLRELKLKTLCMSNKNKVKNMVFMNVLQPVSSFDNEYIEIDNFSNQTNYGFVLTKDSSKEVFIYSNDNEINFDNIKSDASLISLVYENDKLCSYAVYNGSYLVIDNVELFKTDKKDNVIKKYK